MSPYFITTTDGVTIMIAAMNDEEAIEIAHFLYDDEYIAKISPIGKEVT